MSDIPNIAKFYNRLTTEALLYKYQFYIEFHFDKELEAIIGDKFVKDNELKYFAQSAEVPEESLSTGTTTYFGKDFKSPGVKQWQHSWQVKFILQENFDLYKKLKTWQRWQSDLSKNSGGRRRLTNTYVVVNILNADNSSIARRFVLQGVWIKSLPEISLAYKDGGGDAQTGFTVDFRFQWKEDWTDNKK